VAQNELIRNFGERAFAAALGTYAQYQLEVGNQSPIPGEGSITMKEVKTFYPRKK
jgi:hypothetical protein